MSHHDNPYDAAEMAAHEDDRRRALDDCAAEAENERRQLRKVFSSTDPMQARSIISNDEPIGEATK